MVFNLSGKINFYSLITLLALAVYITTAFNSHGFYHADEHYQIIEFAGLKLGTHTPDNLAWEYQAKIRPAIQPFICFVVFKGLETLGISNPYSQAFFLRLLSALCAILIIRFFIRHTQNQIANEGLRKFYYVLSYFLWFIPFISVRFSSETWSGLFFLLSLAIFMSDVNNARKPYLSGFVLGFSFLFRYQIAFAIIGFVLWLMFIQREKIIYLIKLFASFLLAILIGFCIDCWFYGELVFTPWKYFYVNILEDAASGFGTSPWYYYLENIISAPGHIIGVGILALFLTLLILQPKNIFLWCLIPFILIHSIIPHKEERFLFPMAYLFPIITILAYARLILLIRSKLIHKLLNYSLAIVFVIINFIGLAVMATKSAGIGRMELTKYIHDNYGNARTNLIYCSWANPYNPWHGLPMKFYVEEGMVDRRINSLCELNDSLILTNVENFLVIRKIDLESEECAKYIKQNDFQFVKQSVPEWIERINNTYKGFENYNILVLYKYEGALENGVVE